MAGNNQVQVGLFDLVASREQNELAIDAANSNSGNRSLEWDIADRQSRAGCIDR